jgi:hypothetical protein
MVPASVPSLIHNSCPFTGSAAEKKINPLKFVRLVAFDGFGPG